jgi:hypothetical protein
LAGRTAVAGGIETDRQTDRQTERKERQTDIETEGQRESLLPLCK